MRPTLCITALAAALLTTSCASKGPGHGYRLVRVSGKSQGSETDSSRNLTNLFGLVGSGGSKTTDLYSGDQRLGGAGQYSISPSGRFAMFDDAGKLRLFDRNSGQIRDVTDGTFAVPWTFTWDEAAGVVEVTYFQGHDPSKISLRR